MQEEDIIKGRGGAEGQYKRGEGIVQDDITEGRHGAEGGHYKR